MATGTTKPKKRVSMRGLCEQFKKYPRRWTWKGRCVTRREGILITSAEEGHPDCLEICLRAGADVNKHFDYRHISCSDGTTALMITSERGHLQCAKLLLKAGADVNAWNERGYTALSYAAGNGHESVVNVLIGAGADVNDRNCGGLTSLIHAVQYGHDVCVNLLIKSGADVNKEMGGETALMIAVKLGHERCIELLLKAGADLNKEKQGKTALMIAVKLGHERCIELLLKAGADVNNAGYDGNTPLHKVLAVSGNHNKLCSTILKVIRAVLQSGARVNVLNRRYQTPLGYYSEERKHWFGAFAGFACLSWDTSEPCTGDCEREAVRILLAARERASDNSGQMVEAVKPARELTLMELCIEVIRNHLLALDPHLFGRVPKLGLPSLLTEYLLYGASLDDDNGDADTRTAPRRSLRRKVLRR